MASSIFMFISLSYFLFKILLQNKAIITTKQKLKADNIPTNIFLKVLNPLQSKRWFSQPNLIKSLKLMLPPYATLLIIINGYVFSLVIFMNSSYSSFKSSLSSISGSGFSPLTLDIKDFSTQSLTYCSFNPALLIKS